MLFDGLAHITPLQERALSKGSWRLLATVANRMPTAASYQGTRRHGPRFDVLRIACGRIA